MSVKKHLGIFSVMLVAILLIMVVSPSILSYRDCISSADNKSVVVDSQKLFCGGGKGDNVAPDGSIYDHRGFGDGSHPPKKVIDGNRHSFGLMTTEGGTSHADSFVIIDLTKKYVLHSMWLKASHQANSAAGKIRISISNDHEDWIKIWENDNIPSNCLLTPYDWDVSACQRKVARYIKVTGFYTGGDFPSNIYRIYELNVFELRDTSEPDTTILKYPPDGSSGDTIDLEFEWTGTDDVTPKKFLRYSYQFGPVAGNPQWSDWTRDTRHVIEKFHPTNEKYFFEVRAKDMAGNVDTSPARVTFFLYKEDKQPPALEITKPGNALYMMDREILPFFYPVVVGSITVECDVSDEGSGVNQVKFYVDGNCEDTTSQPPYEHTLSGLKGRHTIKVKAFDNCDNINTETIDVFFVKT